MSEKAIQAEGLGKQYRIGLREKAGETFPEALVNAVCAPFRRFHTLKGRSDGEDLFWALRKPWMFLSPVVYPISLIPERYQWILGLNPMTGIIQGFRSTLLNRPIDWPLLGTAVLVSAGMLVIGVWNFRRAERRFADVV